MRKAIVLAACLVSRSALAQTDCEKKWDAVYQTKSALTDCLRSGKSCKAEFAAADAARAAVGNCEQTPETEDRTPDGIPIEAAMTPAPASTPFLPSSSRRASPVSTPNPAGEAGDDPRVGLGFGLTTGRAQALSLIEATQYPSGPLTVRLPILGSKVRFEPELGFDRDGFRSSFGGESFTFVVSTFRMAAALHYVSRRAGDATIVYFGPRLGIDAMSVTQNDSADSDQNGYRTDFLASLAFGGEHFFSRRFSVGGEVHLATTFLLGASVTGASAVNTTGNSISTQAALLVRWYY